MTNVTKLLTILTFCLLFQLPFILTSNASTTDPPQTDLAVWTFPTTAADRLIADTGVLSGQVQLSAQGRRSNATFGRPTFATGANAGQMFIDGWDSANIFDKYWLIQTILPVQSILQQYTDIEISFSAFSSNTGPARFVLEARINNAWVHVANYTLTNSVQHFTFQLPDGVRENEHLQIRLRASRTNESVIGLDVGLAGTSRLFNIAITARHVNNLPMEEISRWQFTSLDLFRNNATFVTSGTNLSSTFSLVGSGNLNMGVGSAAGQLFVNGWGGADGLTPDRYWNISTHTIGYSNIQISFSAHSSATGPRNFVMEVNIGDGWVPAAHYTLASSRQDFRFNLPASVSNVPELDIRFRPLNNTAINGNTVQPAGTSRMYNIVISGVSDLAPISFTHVQNIEQGTEYAIALVAAAQNPNFTLRYNHRILDITGIHELSGAAVNIISHEDGVLVFSGGGNEDLTVIVLFTAKADGTAVFVFE